MSEKLDEMLTKLRAAQDERMGRVYRQYSGRGMFGKTCIGFVTGCPTDLVAEIGVRGSRTDSLGLDTIVYWPNIEDDGRDSEVDDQ
jgi:hypothetical protein